MFSDLSECHLIEWVSNGIALMGFSPICVSSYQMSSRLPADQSSETRSVCAREMRVSMAGAAPASSVSPL